MINVVDYINTVLNKKKWTRRRLCDEINKIEQHAGVKERTTYQNITNYLNGYHNIRPKWLVKVELALELPYDTLVNMVKQPISYDGKKELEEVKRKFRND